MTDPCVAQIRDCADHVWKKNFFDDQQIYILHEGRQSERDSKVFYNLSLFRVLGKLLYIQKGKDQSYNIMNLTLIKLQRKVTASFKFKVTL